MSELLYTPDSDIYTTWGENPNRMDVPAIGEEYKQWKDSTPPEVQKIVLDYMTARNMQYFRGYMKIEADARENRHYKGEDAEEFRLSAIEKAEVTANEIEAFFSKNYPEQIPNIVMIGMDGSSLYRPRKGGDVDIWVMVKDRTREFDDALYEFKLVKYESQKDREIQIRAVIEHPTADDLQQGHVPVLSLPHKVLVNLTGEEDYIRLKQETDRFVLDNKRLVYNTSRNTASYWN